MSVTRFDEALFDSAGFDADASVYVNPNAIERTIKRSASAKVIRNDDSTLKRTATAKLTRRQE